MYVQVGSGCEAISTQIRCVSVRVCVRACMHVCVCVCVCGTEEGEAKKTHDSNVSNS